MADVTITAANVAAPANTRKRQVTAGATVTAGQPIYQDANDNFRAKPAIATSAATARDALIALHGAAAGQPLTVLEWGRYTAGGTLVVGTVYAVSAAAAGGIAPIADLATGNFVTVLGVAVSAADLMFDPIVSGVAKP